MRASRRPPGPALLLAWTLAGFGCAPGAPPEETLTIAVRSDVTGFYPNPPTRTESYTYTVNQAIYDSLVGLDRSLGVRPALAVKWSTPDEHTFILQIREGVRFSDGRPLTAADVTASIDAALRRGWGIKDYLQPITNVRTLGDRRLEVTTEGSNLTLLARLTWSFVLPAAAVDETPVEVLGSGPYRLESWSPGEEFTLVRNEHYWGRRPDFERVRYVVIPDADERIRLVTSGEAQMADYVPPEHFDRLERAPDVRLDVGVGHRVLYLGLRMDTAPFSDPRVREAIDMGIDRRELVERALSGHAEPAAQLVRPTIVGHNPELAVCRPDRERARRLLAEAGYAAGLAVTLDGPKNRYVNDVQILAELSRQLAEIGLGVEARAQDKLALYERVVSGRAPFHLLGWASETGDGGDAVEFLAHTPTDTRLGRMNTTAMNDAQIDALHAAAESASTMARRSQHLQAAHARIVELRAILPLVVQREAVLSSARVAWTPPLNMEIHPAEVRKVP